MEVIQSGIFKRKTKKLIKAHKLQLDEAVMDILTVFMFTDFQ